MSDWAWVEPALDELRTRAEAAEARAAALGDHDLRRFDQLNAASAEILRLRAELAKVTAERDEARANTAIALDVAQQYAAKAEALASAATRALDLVDKANAALKPPGVDPP